MILYCTHSYYSVTFSKFVTSYRMNYWLMDLGKTLVNLYPKLERYAVSLTRAKDTAEDLVMDVIKSLLERQAQFDDNINVEAYALRAVQNKFLDSKRYKTRNLTETELGGEGDFMGEILDETAGNKAFDRIQFEEMIKALGSIGRDCIQLLTQVGLGYRYNEIPYVF